jgi:hypothetical protein
MRRFAIPVLPALLLFAACATPREPALELPEVGSPAPELSVRTVDGGDFSLREAAARGPVVVVFYRGLF